MHQIHIIEAKPGFKHFSLRVYRVASNPDPYAWDDNSTALAEGLD